MGCAHVSEGSPGASECATGVGTEAAARGMFLDDMFIREEVGRQGEASCAV